MIEQGAELGLKPSETLDLTVRELRAFARGCHNRDDENRRMALWAAWHMANWSKARRVPSLRGILRKLGGREPVKRTTMQLLKMAEHLNALFGGKDMRGQGKPRDKDT